MASYCPSKINLFINCRVLSFYRTFVKRPGPFCTKDSKVACIHLLMSIGLCKYMIALLYFIVETELHIGYSAMARTIVHEEFALVIERSYSN